MRCPARRSPRTSSEVVLREEEPVVEKRTVAKERVRIGTETHEDEREVSEEIRKEQIDVDDTQRR